MNRILLLTKTNESNPMNHHQLHAIRVLGSICLFLLTLAMPARAQEEWRDFPLGPIGGIYHVTGGSSLARITSLTAGEPGAMAGLQVNDYIYGAFGQVFTPTGGYHYGVSQELGFAVDRAEGADGVLPLMIMRAGTGPLTINVNLTAAGAFGVAYPRNSAKHAAVYETAIAYLHTAAINGNGNVGYPTGWTGLALLGHPNWNSTTGAKPYRLSINLIRDLVIGQLNAWPYAPCEDLLLPSVAGQANGGDNPNHVGGASNWELGQKVMFLAEYYAKTSALNESDKATVAAALQRGAEMCGNSIQWWKQPSQTGVGGFSPEYDQVAGMCSHGGVTGDYMHQGWYCGINMTGVYSFNGMAFSRRAGVDMTVRPKDGHYFGYTLTQGDPIPAGATNALPASITLPQYGADPQRGSTITDPFWYDPSIHQKFVMQLNFLARRSTWYNTANPLTGEDGMVGYAPETINSYDAGGRTPGTLLGMAMYNQDVGGLDAADLARLESLKGYISRNYMQHQEAHAYCVGAQVYQALATSYLSDRQQRFFMDNWRFFFALSRTNTNGFKYFPARTVWDNYLDTTLCAALNIALPYGIANGNYSLVPGYNTTRTLANFKSPALMWPSIEARTCTVRTSTQAFQTDVCDGNGNVLAPGNYTATWSHVSGPATATFSPNNTANTTVTLPSVSATPYRIRLTVTRAGFPTLTEDIDVTRADPDSVIAASITTQPVAQTTVPGGSASFTVALTGSGPFLYQWQLDGVPCWGARTSPTLNLTNLGSGAVGAYRCVVTTPSGTLISNSVPLTINSTPVRTPGGLRREVWNGIGGTTIADLTSIASFPRFPSLSGVVASAEASTDYSDNYGQKLSGWIKPPATGKYKFFLASDDASQLWLSTDESASNKVKIADLPYGVGFRAYSSGAQSVLIDLVAGQKYYLEILHKEATGGDHLSVAWQLPGEAAPATNSAPIDGIYLECDQYQHPVWSSAPATVSGSNGQTLNTGLFDSTHVVYAENTGGAAQTFDGINFAAGTINFGGTYNGFHEGGRPSQTGAWGSSGPNTVTLGTGSLPVLTIGQRYKIQVLVYDGRVGGITGRSVSFDGINQGIYANGISGVTWGDGLLVTGTFTADATTQAFTVETFSGGTSAGGQINALVLSTLPSLNTAPVANNQSVNTPEDTAKAITLTATDAELDPLTYSIVSPPAHGALTGTAPNITYTPAANYYGADSFTFKANDGTVDSAIATVTLAVAAVNDVPVATDQSVTTAEDTAKAITLAGADVEGSTLTYAVVTQPAHGTLTGTAPDITYTPAANYYGADSFSFKVNDGMVDSTNATVSITVTTVNDAPVATAQSVTTAEDTAKAITLAGTDVEGSTLTYTVVTQPGHGTLSGTAPNITYTPTANYNGADSFTFKVNDGTVDSANATVSITISLPLPWVTADIGTGMLAGSTTFSGGTFTQAGSGIIGSTSDKLRFTYQTLTGDGEIIARISSLQNTGTSSRVGVMIRDTLAANSKQIFMGMTSSGAYRWVRRTATGGSTSSSNSSTGTVPNTWVRVVRSGTTITAYKSTNGTSWTTVGSTTGTTFASTCYIGLAVGSGSDTTLNTSQFSNVSVIP
jgi:hypothetical protein